MLEGVKKKKKEKASGFVSRNSSNNDVISFV